MKKFLIIILPVLLLFTGCTQEKNVEPDTRYEAVAKLYTEMLWRPLEDSDEDTLALCSESVKDKIKTTSETAQELLRRLKYLTRDEVSELIGPLDKYYERRRKDWEGMQDMASYRGGDSSTIKEFEPIQVLTQDTYETHVSGNGTYVILEDGNGAYFNPPVQYSGNYTCELTTFENGIYKYKIKLEEGSEFDLYLDVKDGIVERMQENAETNF